MAAKKKTNPQKPQKKDVQKASNAAKRNAAIAALDMVEDGMVLGLGSGSTAEIFIELLGEKLSDDFKVQGVPTSQQTADCAIKHGVPLIDPDKVDRIHLTIDGADEVDENFQMIKGGGACLLREKIIADSSEHMAVIVDGTKMVKELGAFSLPVEVDPFAMGLTAERVYTALMQAGCKTASTTVRQKKKGKGPLVTDGGNFILDCDCTSIPNPPLTASLLASVPGVMSHGLFIDLADTIIIGEDDIAKVMEIVRE
ncbi:MAG: ribose 5-phosphate isomerase A [Robiginitomaculum sp.]|nr:MAG: ribose 5-phosphate isomerase A [Robiginitomaculum sp.]